MNTGKAAPSITCICVTRHRPTFVKNAIAYFQNQTFLSKQLIIVYEGEDSLPWDIVSDCPDITVVEIPSGSGLTLGERRNLAIKNAEGDYVCVWDDDDWHHPHRLETQLNSLRTHDKPANVLSRLMLFDSIRHETYLSSQRCWEGTLLCRKDIFNDTLCYGILDHGEDEELLSKLKKRNLVSETKAPFLYTYVYHGDNTCDSDHFKQLFAAGYKLD